MSKYIITFGSDQLPEVAHKVRPLKVMLVIEADSEYEARDIALKSFVGKKFCTSYPYSKAQEFKDNYNMEEYSMKDLEGLRDQDD